jgi:hypothetical protein
MRKRGSKYGEVHERFAKLAGRPQGTNIRELLTELRKAKPDASEHDVHNRLQDMRTWESRDIRAQGGKYRLVSKADAPRADTRDFATLRAIVAREYGVSPDQVEVRIVL